MAKFIQKRFKPIETVIALCLIAMLISVVYNRYEQLSHKARINITRMDLNNIKMALRLFYIKEARFPARLLELKERGLLKVHVKDDQAVFGSQFEKESLLDPFGNKYVYDSTHGQLHLSSKTKLLLNDK